ncbi:MAG: AlpA family transcriptional regulator [Amaricoccus sp.]
MNALLNSTALPASPTAAERAAAAAVAAVPNALLRTPEVCAVTGYARQTLYQKMAEGLFPRPIKLGEKSSAWPASEVNAILAARIAGRTDEAIRALVVELTAKRASCA